MYITIYIYTVYGYIHIYWYIWYICVNCTIIIVFFTHVVWFSLPFSSGLVWVYTWLFETIQEP